MYRISKRKSLLALASLVFAVMAVGEIAMAAKYDYKAMGIEHRIYEETGIELFEDYRKRRCILANKEDHCLPSGYVQAVELGGIYVRLWEVEVLLMQERDKEADRILKQIHKEHPKLAKPLWLLAKIGVISLRGII